MIRLGIRLWEIARKNRWATKVTYGSGGVLGGWKVLGMVRGRRWVMAMAREDCYRKARYRKARGSHWVAIMVQRDHSGWLGKSPACYTPDLRRKIYNTSKVAFGFTGIVSLQIQMNILWQQARRNGNLYFTQPFNIQWLGEIAMKLGEIYGQGGLRCLPSAAMPAQIVRTDLAGLRERNDEERCDEGRETGEEIRREEWVEEMELELSR
ncbi:hypothetical protein BD779DRAFT_1474696 [Infundibulicybe gibba]|nr:hypothetical protein BD779DRAFT_1474696 [Infundibulicybe gibba]